MRCAGHAARIKELGTVTSLKTLNGRERMKYLVVAETIILKTNLRKTDY
jgi:hypothetical protein